MEMQAFIVEQVRMQISSLGGGDWRIAAIATELCERDRLSEQAQQPFQYSHQAYRWSKSNDPAHAEHYRRTVRTRNFAAHSSGLKRSRFSDTGETHSGEQGELFDPFVLLAGMGKEAMSPVMGGYIVPGAPAPGHVGMSLLESMLRKRVTANGMVSEARQSDNMVGRPLGDHEDPAVVTSLLRKRVAGLWGDVARVCSHEGFCAKDVKVAWGEELSRAELIIRYSGYGNRENHQRVQAAIRAIFTNESIDRAHRTMIWVLQNNT